MTFPTLLKRPQHKAKRKSRSTIAPSHRSAWIRDLIMFSVAMVFAFLVFAAVYIGF
jgi:hypothetical protein